MVRALLCHARCLQLASDASLKHRTFHATLAALLLRRWTNVKWTLLLLLVVLLVAFGVFLAACRGLSCVKKR